MEARLEQLVEFERACCGGLVWSLQGLEDSNRVRLQVDGIDPNHALLAPAAGY